MASIEVHQVHKSFGKTAALRDLTFSVEDGEFFCLLGASGAGKTTTLKSIAGLVEPDSGTVALDGRDVSDVEPTHRGMAMCFESYALYPQLNVYDNLASPLRSPLMRLPAQEIEQRIQRVAETLGITALLRRGITELSNGQRQRVALGRVMVRPARGYLLDEPLAHLDAKLRATMRAELKAISRDDATTTVYVTHDYVEALSLADRIAVIDDGAILQVGDPETLWSRPDNVFVAQAFGKPRMNLLTGGLVDSGAGVEFASDDGAIRLPLPRVEATAPAPVKLGVRPRDLRLRTADESTEGFTVVSGHVYVLEHLGRLTEVTLQVGGNQLSVVASRSAVRGMSIDDTVELAIDPDTVHVFDSADNGKRVSP